MMFCLSVDLLLTYCFISLVWIIKVIGYFSYFVYIDVCLDVYSTVIGYFRYHTRIMMHSGFWNSRSTYCFRFRLNFLHWSLAFLWSAVVPNTAPKSYNYLLKFWIDDMYSGRLKHMPRPPSTWWIIITPQPPWPSPRPPFPAINFLVLLWARVVVVSPSNSFLPTDVGAFSISGFMTFSF